MALSEQKGTQVTKFGDDGWDNYYRALAADQPAWSDEADPLVAHLIQLAFERTSVPTVMDVGCGDGRNLTPWCATTAQLLGADISYRALELVAQRTESIDARRPILLQASMTDLTCIRSGSVDVVQCIDALPQVDDVAAALSEFARVLRPNGICAFNVFTPDDCAFGEGERLNDRTFRYNDTLFRFYVDGDVEALLPRTLSVTTRSRREWVDPPHVPFRPYEHTHVAFYYLCAKSA